jgi:predicted alpha/beta superfamily hydrolase
MHGTNPGLDAPSSEMLAVQLHSKTFCRLYGVGYRAAMKSRSAFASILLLVGLIAMNVPGAVRSADKPDEQMTPMVRVVRAARDVTIEPSRRIRAKGFNWDHEIQIALPPSYFKNNKAYPVLWVMDGGWWFEDAVTIVNVLGKKYLPEMIVIGVGSPREVSDEESEKRRLYDFTPTSNGPQFDGFGSELARRDIKIGRKGSDGVSLGGAFGFGGAPPFLAFLVDTIRPLLARDYRMANEHILFGDSGGGIFCTYALLARPEAFANYICGSPALNWGNHELFRMEERYSKTHEDLPVKVFFGAGEAELLEAHPLGIVSSMARMVEILKERKYPSLKIYARMFPAEGHLSVIPINLLWGLRTLFQDDPRIGEKPQK